MDAYDKGEGEYSLMTAEMAMAHADANRQVDYVDTDEGERLTMMPGLKADWMQTADSTYRVLLFYKRPAATGLAEGVSMSRVGVMLPKGLNEGKTADGNAEDVMKTDPLQLQSIWASKDGRWLNMRLGLMTGKGDDEKALQTIGLVPDSAASTKDHLRLLFYHDQGGQPEYYTAVSYVSVPFEAIGADTVTLTVNTYSGVVSSVWVKGRRVQD